MKTGGLAMSLIQFLFAAMLALAHPAASAAGGDTVWACGYLGGATIHCALRRAGTTHTSHARVADLPGITPVLRSAPARLRGVVVSIPLLSDQAEPDRAAELAHAVMCGSNRNCRVDFAPGLDAVARLIDRMEDPALDPADAALLAAEDDDASTAS